jgi:fluoride exporter
MSLIYVGVGGAFGSIARYHLGKVIAQRSKGTFPVGTFIINLSGALLLGSVTGIDVSRNVYMLIADGFLGAYTTFSTFMYEGFNLFQDNEKKNAVTYISGTLILGIIGYMIGFGISKILNK